jgi:nucleoside-diphosphate-sugar epimerase
MLFFDVKFMGRMDILVIGGTGIVGKPFCDQARNKHNLTVLAKDEGLGRPPRGIRFYEGDRKDTDNFGRQLSAIVDSHGPFDGVFDICQYDEEDARVVHDVLKGKTKKLVILSTTLVYDRSNLSYLLTSPDLDLAEEGVLGGYVDGKIGMEKFWRNSGFRNLAILRPYHILGKGSVRLSPPT